MRPRSSFTTRIKLVKDTQFIGESVSFRLQTPHFPWAVIDQIIKEISRVLNHFRRAFGLPSALKLVKRPVRIDRVNSPAEVAAIC